MGWGYGYCCCGCVKFRDEFDLPDDSQPGTPWGIDLSGDYTEKVGTWTIQGGKLVNESPSDGHLLTILQPYVGVNYTCGNSVEAIVTFASGGKVGLIIDAGGLPTLGSPPGYVAGMISEDTVEFKYFNGTSLSLHVTEECPASPNTAHKLRVCQSNQYDSLFSRVVHIYLDDVLVLQTNSWDFFNCYRVGVFSGGTGAVSFDNFKYYRGGTYDDDAEQPECNCGNCQCCGATSEIQDIPTQYKVVMSGWGQADIAPSCTAVDCAAALDGTFYIDLWSDFNDQYVCSSGTEIEYECNEIDTTASIQVFRWQRFDDLGHCRWEVRVSFAGEGMISFKKDSIPGECLGVEHTLDLWTAGSTNPASGPGYRWKCQPPATVTVEGIA